MCLCRARECLSVLSPFAVASVLLPRFRKQESDLPLKHHQAVRVAADIWVHRHGVHETLVVLAVEELEPIHPHFFDVARVDPAVAVGR